MTPGESEEYLKSTVIDVLRHCMIPDRDIKKIAPLVYRQFSNSYKCIDFMQVPNTPRNA